MRAYGLGLGFFDLLGTLWATLTLQAPEAVEPPPRNTKCTHLFLYVNDIWLGPTFFTCAQNFLKATCINSVTWLVTDGLY